MNTVHLKLSDEGYKRLKQQKAKGKYSNYSLLVESLLKLQEQDELYKRQLDLLLSKNKLILELLKQFYSDMNLVGLSDPNKCKNLQTFFNKRNQIVDD